MPERIDINTRLVTNEQFERVTRALDAELSALKTQIVTMQEANIAPMLENSLLLVELRRIADALEARPRRVVVHYDQQEAAPQPCDCDELWRLAQAWEAACKKGPSSEGQAAIPLIQYVREHS